MFYALLALWIGPGIATGGHAVMFKREPRSATIWLFVSFALPILGPCLYFGFGINRIERHAVRRLGRRERPFDAVRLDGSPPHLEGTRDAVAHLQRLRDVADHVTRLPLLPGNRITPLHNGEQAYPRMLEAIAHAERSVTLASYIFDWDETGHRFADALAATSRRGVHVHVLVDGIGAVHSFSRMGRRLLETGAHVASFFPLSFPFGRVRLNLRNHRKILVIDGHTGFTGGMNISRRHMVSSGARDRVEDLHFEITGPVVAEMQHTFVEDWTLATDELLEGDRYFPAIAPTGSALCRGISSGPDEDMAIVHWIILGALAAAEHSVRIATPYFVPSPQVVSAMSMAVMRGVRVKLYLPSLMDPRFMRWAADAFLWQLLEHDVEVYRRPPPFVHTKLMIVDDRWVLLGSANLDPRSFRLNFEFNVEAFDADLAQELGAWLDGLIASSTRVSLADVDSRSMPQRLRDGFVRLFAPHL